MSQRHRATRIVAALAAGACLACSEETPVGPDMHHMSGDVANVTLEPFTFRAPLDPYLIHQLPDFLMFSKERTDIVIQRSVFAPGPGMWHTHPGPSFIYVIEGEVKLQRHSRRRGCTETPVHGPGTAYFEIANEVHRAVVTSAQSRWCWSRDSTSRWAERSRSRQRIRGASAAGESSLTTLRACAHHPQGERGGRREPGDVSRAAWGCASDRRERSRGTARFELFHAARAEALLNLGTSEAVG